MQDHKCREHFGKVGVCMHTDCRRKRLPVFVEFWATNLQAEGFTRGQARAWFMDQARQPWAVFTAADVEQWFPKPRQRSAA